MAVREYVAKNNDFSEYEHLSLVRVDRNGTHYYVDHKCPKCGGTGYDGGIAFLSTRPARTPPRKPLLKTGK